MDFDFSECVAKAQAGDADAFAKLYSMVYKDLYRIALCSLNSSHDASDVVSDTVLDAFSSIKKLKNQDAFKAWIIKILTVKIKNMQRNYIESRNNTVDTDSVEQEETGEINYSGFEIMEEFKHLSDDERLVLSLSVVGGYSSDEIAKICKATPSTVRSKIARAKIKLKSRLLESQ